MRKPLLPIYFGLFLTTGAFLGAQSPAISSHLEGELRSSLEKQTVLVRHFYEGSLLRYDKDAHVVGAPEGSWTVTGYIEIQRVRITDGVIIMEARRLAAIYDQKQRNMRLARYGEPVVIKVPTENDADAQKKLKQVFVTVNEDQVALVPSYWRHYAETHEIIDLKTPFKRPADQDIEPNNGVYRVGGSVSPPKPLKMPEPRFTQFARKFQIQGNTALTLVVDENGEPQDISIAKPLGAGLDEAAVEAVKQWRFEPARKNGQPVKVRILVETNYHLGY
jgi:TonB family protein